MIKEEFVGKRVMNMMLIFLITVAYTVALCVKEGVYLDKVICLILIDVAFFLLFAFILERNRNRSSISRNKETDYGKIVQGYGLAALLGFGCSFFPEFAKPVLILPLVVTALGNMELAFISSTYLWLVMGMIMSCTGMEMTSGVMLILFGIVLAKTLEDEKMDVWHVILVVCLSISFPVLFYYINYETSQMTLMIWGAVEGLAISGFLGMFDEKMQTARDEEVENKLDDILDKEYPLAKELKNFSKKEYLHAKRVSLLSAECAALLGRDSDLCRAAGFYYRIGILEGDKITENGVKLAMRHCFPSDVAKIIYEYYGEYTKPSTIESAIVQMVDGVVKKMEVLDSNAMKSEWNQNMVIYQTLNDFSAQGMYDESGLSMNMFLKIREYLVNREHLM